MPITSSSNQILVDCSNRISSKLSSVPDGHDSNAEYLDELLNQAKPVPIMDPCTDLSHEQASKPNGIAIKYVPIVKAFNVLSAYALEKGNQSHSLKASMTNSFQ